MGRARGCLGPVLTLSGPLCFLGCLIRPPPASTCCLWLSLPPLAPSLTSYPLHPSLLCPSFPVSVSASTLSVAAWTPRRLKKGQGAHLSLQLFFFFFKFIYLFIYFCLQWVFIAVCGLSLVVASGGFSPVAVCGLLIATASLVEKHRL